MITWRTADLGCVAFREDAGVLELRLHSNDGPLRWGDKPHRELGDAFRLVADDRTIRAVVITGTGSAFINERYNSADAGAKSASAPGPPASIDSETWSSILFHGERLLTSFLAIPVPVIAAINGPATIHGELPLLADIVLATPETEFAEPHFALGLVPGDGAHVVWPMLLGETRANYFLYTGKAISVESALAWGLVNEVVARDVLLERAWELARSIAERPRLVVEYTHLLLRQTARKRMQDSLGHGLALEGLAANSYWPAQHRPRQ